ncbi:MAG: GNAT family N-acetyltransferase [Anaerolineaceae bacterium]|nr:GNAT family N-acetyltransferase [Anaerolineaceae bacterium]
MMIHLQNFPKIRFRNETPTDESFLYHLYSSTRALELSQVDWNDVQKETFLTMQFQAQRKHYREYYADAEFLIIEEAGQPVGRLYLQDRGQEIRIVDIALVPSVRGKGIGTSILKHLQEAAQNKQQYLGIHVERFNPALHLYRRLGFREVEDKGVYFFMEWRGEKE